MDTNDKLVRTRGIVLREVRYKESSRIIDLFTHSRGRVNIFVPGALRPKNNLMFSTERFVESEFNLRLKAGRFYIEGAEVLNSNLKIANNLKNYLIAEILGELILKTMPENLVDETVYLLVTRTFELLRGSEIHSDFLRVGFMLKYVSLLGYRPNLSLEQGYFSDNTCYFSVAEGGLIEPAKHDYLDDIVKLTKDEFKFIMDLLYGKFEDYRDIKVNDRVLKKVDELVYEYLLFNTEIDSLEFRNKYLKMFGN